MEKQHPFVDEIDQYIRKQHLLEPGDGVVIGVSGGGDSMCLFSVLQELQSVWRLRLHVVHVNHMLRKEAAEEEAYVQNQCQKHRIPCSIYRKDIAAYAEQLGCAEEEAGRRYRYACFQEVCEQQGYEKIAVAHHRNDRVETMLFHMVRGTGLKGLSGIPAVRGRIIRPLLAVSRSQIDAYLQEKQIHYYTDETNLSCDYTRNYIRHQVVPALEQVNDRAVEHMAELADRANTYWQYVEHQAEEWETKCVCALPHGEKLIWQENPEQELVLEHLLYRMMTRVAGSAKDLEQQHVEKLRELLTKPVGKRLSLPYGMAAVREEEGIILWDRKHNELDDKNEEKPHREYRVGIPGVTELGETGRVICRILDYTEDMEISKKLYTKMLDYDKIYDTLCIRTPREGDYFMMNQQGGHKRLSRFFIDQKVPADKRASTLVLAQGSQILWILGMRISEDMKITSSTRRVLRIEFQYKGVQNE